jgi:hypothetical protein
VASGAKLLSTHDVTVDEVVAAIKTHVHTFWYLYASGAGIVAYLVWQSRPSVYLVDFAVFRAPPEWISTREDIITIMRGLGTFTDDTIDFLRRLLDRSGTGDGTAWPPNIRAWRRAPLRPARTARIRDLPVPPFPLTQGVCCAASRWWRTWRRGARRLRR